MLRAVLALSLVAAGLLAGCSEPEPVAPVVAVQPPPVPVDEAVDWTATLGAGVCFQANAVATVSACGLSMPAPTAPGSSEGYTVFYFHDADGRDLAGGHLQLAWDPLTIATEGLRVFAWIMEDCPDECTVNRTIYTTAGTSPIEIPVDAMDLRKDMTVAIAVTPADLYQGASASAGQEIHLTGTLSFVEDPDGDPPEPDEDEDDD
jgi:hypothetical protein